MAALEKPEAPAEFFASTCPHDCPSTCALEVEKLDDHRIGRVRGAKEHSYTAGVICAKVARYAERVHHPDRLTEPLRRVGPKGSGTYEPIGWEAALDEIAEALLTAEQRDGSEAVWPYYYAGTMGLVQQFATNRLRHAKRYSGQYSTICVTLAWSGFIAGTGALRGADPREMRDSDLVVIWGTNPVNTQINVMTHAMHARKARKAKVVVIDTYRNSTAAQADMHLCVRPGTDGALACAVMHVLFKEGYADRDYLAKYTDVPDELEAHLADKTPAWAAAITGLGADEIIAFARLYGATKKSFLRLGYGFARQRNGSVNMHAALSLAAVTGAWQSKGGGAFHNNGGIYTWDRDLIEGLGVRDPSIRLLDQSRIGPILTGDAQALGDGPPVRAMLVQNTNPMSVAPELAKVHQGFAREDLFVAVHEQFMTETARVADIVLPATMFLEHDDVYQQGGSSFVMMGAKVIEPLPECRSNHEVVRALAKRLGAEHPSFEMDEWDWMDTFLKASNLPDAATLKEQRWHDCILSFESQHYLDGFAHPDGKFRFAPDWLKSSLSRFGIGEAPPRLPDHWAVIEAADAECPFRLVTAPARGYLNSTFNETPTSRARERRPSVMIHPKDADGVGIVTGARVRMGNARGSVVLHAELFDGVQPGVVIHEGICPNEDFEEGIGINVLTSADPGGSVGGAVFHDTAVWIRPAD